MDVSPWERLRQPDDAKGVPLDDQRTEICVIAPKIFSSAVGEAEMIADPKRKPHQDNGDGDKRRRREEALDEALENTFPASDPVSVQQPTTLNIDSGCALSGTACRWLVPRLYCCAGKGGTGSTERAKGRHRLLALLSPERPRHSCK
jgi:hypothetical protein